MSSVRIPRPLKPAGSSPGSWQEGSSSLRHTGQLSAHKHSRSRGPGKGNQEINLNSLSSSQACKPASSTCGQQ
ncbi:hypothetical protein WJX84_004409 [Apatococcus fuscideae]|uniref:Uncharacterized protein n=1 Tax=Apatococcus fuscideae TaxID=2026836 RepID=A0AAW1T0T6_9CHLO